MGLRLWPPPPAAHASFNNSLKPLQWYWFKTWSNHYRSISPQCGLAVHHVLYKHTFIKTHRNQPKLIILPSSCPSPPWSPPSRPLEAGGGIPTDSSAAISLMDGLLPVMTGLLIKKSKFILLNFHSNLVMLICTWEHAGCFDTVGPVQPGHLQS